MGFSIYFWIGGQWYNIVPLFNYLVHGLIVILKIFSWLYHNIQKASVRCLLQVITIRVEFVHLLTFEGTGLHTFSLPLNRQLGYQLVSTIFLIQFKSISGKFVSHSDFLFVSRF